MNNFITVVAYLLISGMVTGLAVTAEYKRCGIVSVQRVEEIAYSSVAWPIFIGAVLYIRVGMIEESKCDE